MPNLRQLEYLVALADVRHFRRAAERTNTTQPTLSEQIKALEARLGCQLVERSATRVVITPLGEQVVEIARRMLRDAGEIRGVAASAGRGVAGLVRLGLPPTIGPYLMQHAAPQLRAQYPELRLYVREELPLLLPRALEDGVHDVIVTPLPVRGAEIVTTPLFREALHLTVAADHPLALREQVTLADIAGEDVLALGPGHQLHDEVARLCQNAGARLRLDFEGTSLDMLREMVVMRLGVTFMPGLYVTSRLQTDPSLKLLRLADGSLSRTIGMAWRKSSARGPTFATLAAFLKDLATRHFSVSAGEP